MKWTILRYGIVLALLAFILKFIEYRFLVRDLTIEFYIGAVAVFFTALGVWAGIRLTAKHQKTIPASAAPTEKGESLARSGISQREYEVLALMAEGYSNQEIADRLFLSLNTIKTHTSNLFNKLDVKRRTQAVQKAKELGILGD